MRKVLPLFVVLGLVLAACQASPSASPSASAPASEAPASQEPFSPTAYPEDGPADCAYGGEFSQISAPDAQTVVFSLCYPDPAFLSKVAFTAFGIQAFRRGRQPDLKVVGGTATTGKGTRRASRAARGGGLLSRLEERWRNRPDHSG